MEEIEIKQTTEYLDMQEETPALTPDLETPPEGKVWRRISDGFIVSAPTVLGKAYIINGKRLKTPIDEKVSDYELVDI